MLISKEYKAKIKIGKVIGKIERANTGMHKTKSKRKFILFNWFKSKKTQELKELIK